MVAQTMTAQERIEERIEEMKRRVLAKKEATKAAERRKAAVVMSWKETVQNLHEQLANLSTIPVVQEIPDKHAVARTHKYFVQVFERGNQPHKTIALLLVGNPCWGNELALISFIVKVDEECNPVVMHDDDKITVEIAMDLATSVVEAHFDEEAVALDDEIPF